MSSKGSADPAGRGPSQPDTSTCRLHFCGVPDGTTTQPSGLRQFGSLQRRDCTQRLEESTVAVCVWGKGGVVYANAPSAVLTGEVPLGPRGTRRDGCP